MKRAGGRGARGRECRDERTGGAAQGSAACDEGRSAPTGSSSRTAASCSATAATAARTKCVHLPPCNPTKIICVHDELHLALLRVQQHRIRRPVADLLPEAADGAQCPQGRADQAEGYKYVNYEGEMAVVFGKVTKTSRLRRPGIASRASRRRTIRLPRLRRHRCRLDAAVKGMDRVCPIGPGLVVRRRCRKSTPRSTRTARWCRKAPSASRSRLRLPDRRPRAPHDLPARWTSC